MNSASTKKRASSGPKRQLVRREPIVALTQRLVHEKRLGDRSQNAYRPVQLGLGMLGHQLLVDKGGGIVAARQAA